jgi:hypothetical protein
VLIPSISIFPSKLLPNARLKCSSVRGFPGRESVLNLSICATNVRITSLVERRETYVEDLPDPVGPIMSIFSLGLILNFTLLHTRGKCGHKAYLHL